jgi:ABC-type nickel/cobalt efflux system permease component RcnA
MRKVPFVGVFWVFALALPFTIIALAGVAYVDLHFSQIVQSLVEFGQSITAGGRGLVAETAERFPEVLGMLIGLIVMLTIYAFVRQPAESFNKNNK